ncbi:MAG: hypothetical protein ACREDF_01220 [Thermoplasmata archaeon]
MAKPPRPRAVAAGFGAYFAIVGVVAWLFAQTLPTPWYAPDITRWIFTTYMLVAAVFLVGLGGLALSIRSSFMRQIREIDARPGALVRGSPSEALPPPLPETQSLGDTVDRDIDELLESLNEVEATATREARAMDSGDASGAGAYVEMDNSGLAARRERLVQRRKFLGRYLFGPALVAAFILGLSGMMLPGADGFAQSNHQLNTALILGIGYSWVGVGWYVAATVYSLVAGREDGRRR